MLALTFWGDFRRAQRLLALLGASLDATSPEVPSCLAAGAHGVSPSESSMSLGSTMGSSILAARLLGGASAAKISLPVLRGLAVLKASRLSGAGSEELSHLDPSAAAARSLRTNLRESTIPDASILGTARWRISPSPECSGHFRGVLRPCDR